MNVLIDTGLWFAYYDGKDSYHQDAVKIMNLMEHHRILIPFPSLYETINTRFCRKKEWVESFRKLINSPQCSLVFDEAYKDCSLEVSFNLSLKNKRAISLVDVVIRQMLSDINLKVDALITFNPSDFEDVCRKTNKIIVSNFNMASVL